MRLARLERDGATILAFVKDGHYLPTGSVLPGAPQDLADFLASTGWQTTPARWA